MNPNQPVPVKPLPGRPLSQAQVAGLPILQKRSIRIVSNPVPARSNKPKGIGPARSLVATYTILTDGTFEGLALQVQARVLEGLTCYGAPMVMGTQCAQAMVTWQ